MSFLRRRDDQPAPRSGSAQLRGTQKAPRRPVTITVIWTGVMSLVLFGPYQGPGPTPADMLLLFAVTACFLGFVWYTMLHTAYRLELTADTLRWRFALSGGEVSITDMRRMRPARVNPMLEIIEFAERRPIRVLVIPGLQQFAAETEKVAPQLETSFAERSGYRRYR
jgi:hypothetical protein